MNYICTVSNFEGFNGNFRIIHTGLCGKLADEILRSIEGQLSDGYWENSPMMEKYWKNEYVLRMDNEEESEIVIVVNGKNGEGKMVPYRWSYREGADD